MADILWDKKTGTYDIVDSNYLTPEPHAHEIGLDIEIEVYVINYGWGLWDGKEFRPPIYKGKMKGQVTSANFTLDSTSDMRSTCSLSIILDEDSPFIVHSNDYLFWEHVWLKITKKYDYPNDIDMYPMFNWGDHIGLWNNNGLFRSDPSQSIIGWFVPNDGSFNYNAESREFSLSCTDVYSFYTDTRGGHLTPWEESFAVVNAKLYSYGDNDESFRQDQLLVANASTGFVLEGAKDLNLQDKQYNNYLTQNQASNVDSKDMSAIWKDSYEVHKEKNEEVQSYDYNYTNLTRTEPTTSANEMLRKVIYDYGHIIPLASVYVNLQNGYELLPFDLEFDGDVTLYDVIKKVTDLYPRQYAYIDTNRRLTISQTALAWNDRNDTVDFRAREFMDLVLDEQWTIDLSNVYNYVVVFGRDQSCVGYFYISDYWATCHNCGKVLYYPNVNYNTTCPVCGNTVERMRLTHNSFSMQSIGARKKTVYDDNLITDEECFDAAKAIAFESCRAKKTLTVTLVDRYLAMYQWADKGVGRRIEYKSKLTGETDVYTLLKWSNDFNSGTVTLELEPFYPCADIEVGILPTPTFTYSVDENGLLTMIMNNGSSTNVSLFKVFSGDTTSATGSDTTLWDNEYLDFIGETCEVYNENEKVFRYQFKRNGNYMLTCQAWSPNLPPSSCAPIQVIEVKCFNERLLAEDGSYLTTDNNEHIVT